MYAIRSYYGLEGPAGGHEGLPVRLLRDLVKLVEIDMVGAHHGQAALQVLGHPRAIATQRLGGQHNPVAHL